MRGFTRRLLLAAIATGVLPITAVAQTKDRTEDEVITTFLNQEADVWELEGKLLREAMAAIAKVNDRKQTEISLRRQIRNSRSSTTLRQVRSFIDDYLDANSIDLLKEVADVNGVEPEDVFADYLTVEATVDFSLMASAYATANGNNLDQFPESARRLLKDLVADIRQPPVPANDIEVGKIRGNRLAITVFGCDIVEEISQVNPTRKSASLTWKSNYFFLRDLKDRVPPKETRDETLTFANGKWEISYEKELEDFLASSGRTEWGKKTKELANIGQYLEKRDPLDRKKSRREAYVYDPEAEEDPSVVSFTGRKVLDRGLDDAEDDLDDRRSPSSRDRK
ncbi:MAG: hypothetical protein U1D30_05845 [Planctomycetota bacterium]